MLIAELLAIPWEAPREGLAEGLKRKLKHFGRGLWQGVGKQRSPRGVHEWLVLNAEEEGEFGM